jgi:hypothetical protein
MIDGMHPGRVDNVEGTFVDTVRGERTVGGDEMEPPRKQQVDLANVLPQRGVTGLVVIDVVGGAQAFARIQDHVGWLEVGAAMRGTARFSATRRYFHSERDVMVLRFGEKQFRQRRHLRQADGEDGPNSHAGNGQHVKDAPQPLPALALRIVEDLLAHSSWLFEMELPRTAGAWLRRPNGTPCQSLSYGACSGDVNKSAKRPQGCVPAALHTV